MLETVYFVTIFNMRKLDPTSKHIIICREVILKILLGGLWSLKTLGYRNRSENTCGKVPAEANKNWTNTIKRNAGDSHLLGRQL